MKLETGDVVWLKSGGPAMTVSMPSVCSPDEDWDGVSYCLHWMDENDTLQSERLSIELLTKVAPSDHFKPGDLVCLKSGGYVVRLVGINYDFGPVPLALIRWGDGDPRTESAMIPLACLTK